MQTRTGQSVAQYQLGSPVFTSPVMVKDHLIVSEVKGRVNCFNLALDLLWTVEVGGNLFSSCEVEGGSDNEWSLFFGCYDNCLYKLTVHGETPLDCKIAWKRDVGAPVYAKPVLNGDTVICCTTKGSVIAVNSKDGSVMGREETAGDLL